MKLRSTTENVDSGVIEVDHTYSRRVADAAVQVNTEERDALEIVKGYEVSHSSISVAQHTL